jgi:hypothetical protein
MLTDGGERRALRQPAGGDLLPSDALRVERSEVLKHGLEPGLEPPDPVEADPATIPEAQREQRGIRRLPATQQEPLDALAADAIPTGALGSGARRTCLAVPRSEWDATTGEITNSSSRATSSGYERAGYPGRTPSAGVSRHER